jgi:O-methyltransferase involved in polyketide biosynthesis
MTKKVKKSSPKKTVNVREIPTDLWDEKLEDYVKKTGKKKYAVVAEALRQFLDREGEK